MKHFLFSKWIGRALKRHHTMLKWWLGRIELLGFSVMLCVCVKQRLANSACHTLLWICWVKEIWSKLPLLSFQSLVSRHAQGHNPTFQLGICRYAHCSLSNFQWIFRNIELQKCLWWLINNICQWLLKSELSVEMQAYRLKCFGTVGHLLRSKCRSWANPVQ